MGVEFSVQVKESPTNQCTITSSQDRLRVEAVSRASQRSGRPDDERIFPIGIGILRITRAGSDIAQVPEANHVPRYWNRLEPASINSPVRRVGDDRGHFSTSFSSSMISP